MHGHSAHDVALDPAVQRFGNRVARRIMQITAVAVAIACSPLGCGPAVDKGEPGNTSPAADESATADDNGGHESDLRVLGTVPEFRLTDQSGADFGSHHLRGKVWIVDFIFTRCRSTCPEQSRQFSQLQKDIQDLPHSDLVRLVSISVDPASDTPSVLAAYADRHGADHERWKFLTGGRGEIWSLSKEGFRLDVGENPPAENNPFFHSQSFVLVDQRSQIRGYYDGLSSDGRRDLRRDLALLLAAGGEDGKSALRRVPYPSDILDPPWLAERERLQRASTFRFEVFHAFRFEDRVESSGIDFQNCIVDDAGKHHKAVHYDHGNGIAIADVDADGLLDIYFTTQLGANQLWRNRGGGRFENFTTSTLELVDKVGVTASFADTDNDGDPDLYVTTVRQGNHLFENDGAGRFRDITETSGLGYHAHCSGAVFMDYDRDGLLDLFLCNVGGYTTDEVGRGGYYIGVGDAFAGHLKPDERNELSRLFRNLGDHRFEDVTREVGLIDHSWTGDASPIDLNDDGFLDLYVLNMQGHDEYYENVRGQRFVKRSRELFPQTPWGSMGIKVFDFNNDGRQDIYITDMHSDMSEDVDPHREKLKSRMRWPESMLQSGGLSIFGNAFYRNDGNQRFSEISDQIGAENYWPWGLSVGDLNADGFEDVFVTSSMNFPFRYGINTVLLNNRGKTFLDSEFVLGIEPRRGRRTAKPWFTLDPAAQDMEHALVKKLGLTEPVEVWGATGSRSSAIFDLDNDGDLDVVTNEFNDGPMVLVSNLSQQKPINCIFVKLRGTRSNRDGLGTEVRVFAGKQVYTRMHDGKSGYLSQSTMPLYFGLDEAAVVDRIELRWASGQVQTVAGPITSNQRLEIVESTTP